MGVKSRILSDHFSVASGLGRHIEEDIIVTTVFFLKKFQVIGNIIGSLSMLNLIHNYGLRNWPILEEYDVNSEQVLSNGGGILSHFKVVIELLVHLLDNFCAGS